MGYRNLLECVRDLEAQKELVRINEPIDPHLEMAEIQRRVFRAGGPALLFTCPKYCRSRTSPSILVICAAIPTASNMLGSVAGASA